MTKICLLDKSEHCGARAEDSACMLELIASDYPECIMLGETKNYEKAKKEIKKYVRNISND